MPNFFTNSGGLSCPTVSSNGLTDLSRTGNNIPLAFSDYDYTVCSGCGTKSITINLAVAWSTDGATLIGHRDLQSVMAHEFGHVLGMGHNDSSFNGACGDAPSPTCFANIGRSTMDNFIYPRTIADPGNQIPNKYETCGRDLGTYDIAHANQLYPALVGGICQ